MQLLKQAIELFIKHVLPKLRPPTWPFAESLLRYSSIFDANKDHKF